MPFDGVNFQPGPKPPSRSPGERIFSLLFLLLAICFLVMPVSAAALVDIVQYIQRK